MENGHRASEGAEGGWRLPQRLRPIAMGQWLPYPRRAALRPFLLVSVSRVGALRCP